MKKDFEAGWEVDDPTGILERPYCNCFVPINIDKWFDRIIVKPEMNALLLQIYQKVGRLEGLTSLMGNSEMQNINSLIDRINAMHCQPDGKQTLDAIHFFGSSYGEESDIQDGKTPIGVYGDINLLRHQHREKFIFLKNTIWAMRKEFNPVSPQRIEDCINDLLDITSVYSYTFRMHKEKVNPVLFSGLLFYQLLTIAPYERNNILYSSFAMEKYMQKLRIFPEISLPFAKLIYANRNECDDRMAEARQECNINQWLIFYLNIMDKALNVACKFIEEQHHCKIKSVKIVNKAKNISANVKSKMLNELEHMWQAPLFRIEDVMKHSDITHSTATKIVNTFISLKIVKQVDDKQRYRVFEYVPLMECIRQI